MRVEALKDGAAEDVLECDAEGVPTDGSNLVIKARGRGRGIECVLAWLVGDLSAASGEPTPKTPLSLQAFNLFRAKTGDARRYRVRLDKRVPHGAGLGGGSGNAATALWAANELAGRPAADADLLAWGGDIGSDISVFFSSGCAYCTGR